MIISYMPPLADKPKVHCHFDVGIRIDFLPGHPDSVLEQDQLPFPYISAL